MPEVLVKHKVLREHEVLVPPGKTGIFKLVPEDDPWACIVEVLSHREGVEGVEGEVHFIIINKHGLDKDINLHDGTSYFDGTILASHGSPEDHQEQSFAVATN